MKKRKIRYAMSRNVKHVVHVLEIDFLASILLLYHKFHSRFGSQTTTKQQQQ